MEENGDVKEEQEFDNDATVVYIHHEGGTDEYISVGGDVSVASSEYE